MHDGFLLPLDAPRACSRRHALKVFAAGAGGLLLGGPWARALADLPWGEEPQARRLDRAAAGPALGLRQAYERAARHMHPALTLEPGGARLWTSWTQADGPVETVCLRALNVADGTWGPGTTLSDTDAGPACESDVVCVGDRVLVAWAQYKDTGWQLCARSLDPRDNASGPLRALAGGKGELHGHPALAVAGDRVLVVWQAKRSGAGAFAVLGRFLDATGEPAGDMFEIAAGDADACHPAVAAAPDGSELAVVFDRQDAPGTQNVYLVTIDARSGRPAAPRAVTRHPASDVAPAVAYSPDGQWVWVAWHSNRRGECGWDITPWYRLAGLRRADGTWHAPVGADALPDEAYARGTVQGFELVRLVVSPGGVVCVLGRASHNFQLQYYTTDGRQTLYRLPEDGWGGRGRLLPGVFAADGALWAAGRDLQTNVLYRIDGFADLAGPPPVAPWDEPTRTATPALAPLPVQPAWPEPAGKPAELKVFFGDIHGHSWQSDGMSDPEAVFLRARDLLDDDFHVLTDHDYFVGKRLSETQWQRQKDLVEHYHAPGRFVTLFGQEWTTARVGRPHGWGHFNVYSADPTIPLFDHMDERWRDLPALYDAMRPHDAIAIPHHIGWTGVPWEAIDVALTPVVEICSGHGAFEYEGNEPLAHRGGMKGCFFRDGLARGLRIGVVGGTDQHGLTWHHGICWKRNSLRAGLTGVWAPELSRATLLAALRERRTFATTGVKMQLYFAVNGELMGGSVKSDGPPELRIDVAAPADAGPITWIELVRDGAVVQRIGGEAQHSRETRVDESCPRGVTCSYYVRVLLAGGDMAWSSPVWVARV